MFLAWVFRKCSENCSDWAYVSADPSFRYANIPHCLFVTVELNYFRFFYLIFSASCYNLHSIMQLSGRNKATLRLFVFFVQILFKINIARDWANLFARANVSQIVIWKVPGVSQ